jgi:hypothetical protein
MIGREKTFLMTFFANEYGKLTIAEVPVVAKKLTRETVEVGRKVFTDKFKTDSAVLINAVKLEG